MTARVENPLRALSLEQLRHRRSVKWRGYPPDVLPLWVAEMDVPVADPVREAVRAAVDRSDTGYANGDGSYAEAFAMFAKQRWDWQYDVERTAMVADVMTGVAEVIRLVTEPGDGVVVNSPVYTPFYRFVEHTGRRVVEAPLTEDHRIDLAGLEETFAGRGAGRSAGRGAGRRGRDERDRPAAYLLCSPHNPTGTVHTTEELRAAGELAAGYGVRVVADEIHAPLVHPGATHVPFLSLPEGSGAFAVLSASKAWNLAGLKAAVVVAGEDAADDLARLPEVVSHGASHFGVLAHTAALTDGGPWLDALLAGLDENRRLLADLLAAELPQVSYRPPEGTYLAWLDCRPLGLRGDPAEVFLEHGRVALNSGPAFGTGGAGHARLNLATSPEILAEAVRRMAAAVAGARR